MNVWLAGKESDEAAWTFPYEAQDPISMQLITVRSLEQVKDLACNVYDANIGKFPIGRALWESLGFFCNPRVLGDAASQARIKEWQFAQKYGFSAGFICTWARYRDFEIIEEEWRQINTQSK